MPHETDLPCSDCGSALEERTERLPGQSTDDAGAATVTVAVCPRCRARHYPERTLSRLADDRDPPSRGS